MNQLPAYLQNRQSAVVKDRAVLGLGSSMPPHISIQGNQFTLIDAANNEQTIGGVMDAVVFDVSDVNCKKYFGKEWTPDSNDAPMCWSANGIGPSRDAQNPQARTCAECPHNVRGSAQSKISGAAIKACRDEKWLALFLPQYPVMLFQLVLTPGSFTNWKAYLAPFEKDANTDVSDVLTRITFEPKVNGVLTFQAVSYIDEPTWAAREKAAAEKATTVLVGRNDMPRQAALPAYEQAQQFPPVQQVQAAIAPAAPDGTLQGQPSPFVAQPAATMMPMTTAAPSVTPVPAVEPQRRRRRNTATPEQAQQPVSQAAPMAPFRPEAQAQQLSSFGVQQPAPMPNELNSTLDSIFGKKG